MKNIMVYKNILIMLLALSLSGCFQACAVADAAPACAVGDCLGLQQRTAGWIIASAYSNPNSHILTLRSAVNPTQIVSFARVANGIGMAGVDLKYETTIIQGTWIKAGDMTAILRSALSKGNWYVISREDTVKLITTGTAEAPALLSWLGYLTIPAELIVPGVFLLPAEIMNDILRDAGFAIGEPG